MLSGEKKVCVANEAIVFSETVDAYEWMVRATVEMTPAVRLPYLISRLFMAMESWVEENYFSNWG